MSWRTVVITSRCKLDLNMGYMVIRGEELQKVFIDEIAVLMLENPAVSLTGSLLCALSEKKVRIIFCDEKRSPYAELEPYYGSFDCSKKLKQQIAWDKQIKGEVWTRIVAEKISNQSELLIETGHSSEAQLLQGYISELEFGDATNREGHAAKVYFNALFGKDFCRHHDDPINSSLNYGYGIILSAVNREVALNGYTSRLGLFHDNMFNFYNLSCDLMEPFRIMVDRKTVELEPERFTSEEKHLMLSLLSDSLTIDNTSQTALNAIKIYVKSVFDALNNNDVAEMSFAEI